MNQKQELPATGSVTGSYHGASMYADKDTAREPIGARERYDIPTIKARFNPQAYAEHVTGFLLHRPDSKGYRRLPGYGGLTVSETGFFHHSAGIGGDALDFVAYIHHGVTCHGRPEHFREALGVAAAFAGVLASDVEDVPDRRRSRPVALRQAPPNPHGPIIREPDYHHVETYQYHAEDGTILFYVERFEGTATRQDGAAEGVKRFVQRPPGRRAGPGCMDGIRRVLYGLPDVLRAVREGESVYIVEGEKDADAANLVLRESIGRGVATTSPGGAGAWYQAVDDHRRALAGAHIILAGDDDDAGIRYLLDVRDSLRDVAGSISVVQHIADALAVRGVAL